MLCEFLYEFLRIFNFITGAVEQIVIKFMRRINFQKDSSLNIDHFIEHGCVISQHFLFREHFKISKVLQNLNNIEFFFNLFLTSFKYQFSLRFIEFATEGETNLLGKEKENLLAKVEFDILNLILHILIILFMIFPFLLIILVCNEQLLDCSYKK